MFYQSCKYARILYPLCTRKMTIKTHSVLGSLYNTSFMSSQTSSNEPTHIVQMRGLDYETEENEIIEFFKPLGITPKTVHLKCDGSGRVAGVSEIEFATHAEAVVAMRKKNAFMGNRFIRLALKSSDLDIEQYKKPEYTKEQSTTKEFNIAANIDGSYHPTNHVVKMKNVPQRMTDQAIFDFFWPIGVSPVSITALYNESGIRNGEFEVHFLTQDDAVRAMAKNNAYIGTKFVELSLKLS